MQQLGHHLQEEDLEALEASSVVALDGVWKAVSGRAHLLIIK